VAERALREVKFGRKSALAHNSRKEGGVFLPSVSNRRRTGHGARRRRGRRRPRRKTAGGHAGEISRSTKRPPTTRRGPSLGRLKVVLPGLEYSCSGALGGVERGLPDGEREGELSIRSLICRKCGAQASGNFSPPAKKGQTRQAKEEESAFYAGLALAREILPNGLAFKVRREASM